MELINVDKQIITKVAKFFELAFPDKNIAFEMKCGYFWEWVDRFEAGSPQHYMDTQRLEAFKRLE